MPPDNTEVLIAIARIEGKLDLNIAEMTALKANDADHETRLRSIEQSPIPDPETAKRIRFLEERRTVTPGQLWAGLLGVVGLIATSLAVINGVIDAFTP